jgi:hypothetical protein
VAGANILSSLKDRKLRCLKKDSVSFSKTDGSQISPRNSESDDDWYHCQWKIHITRAGSGRLNFIY